MLKYLMSLELYIRTLIIRKVFLPYFLWTFVKFIIGQWLQTEPTAALEECIVSILVAIARHSPSCANAVLKCQRLIQTIVQRFTVDSVEVRPSMIKSVSLFKVSDIVQFNLSLINMYIYQFSLFIMWSSFQQL